MQATEPPSFLSSAPRIPSDRDLDKLKQSIRHRANEKGLSSRATERYKAWILGFISWCMRTAPYRVSRDRIDEFRCALIERPNSQDSDVYEAMDALAFLFGAVKESNGMFSFTDACQREEQLDRPCEHKCTLFSSSLSTLTVGWKAQ